MLCAATRSEIFLVFSLITISEVQPNCAADVCRRAMCVFYFGYEELPSSVKELLISCAHTLIWWYKVCVVPSFVDHWNLNMVDFVVVLGLYFYSDSDKDRI